MRGRGDTETGRRGDEGHGDGRRGTRRRRDLVVAVPVSPCHRVSVSPRLPVAASAFWWSELVSNQPIGFFRPALIHLSYPTSEWPLAFGLGSLNFELWAFGFWS